MAAGDLLVNETVQGHGMGPAMQPTRIASLQCMASQVGRSPLMRCFWVFLVVGPGLGLFAVCLFRVGDPGAGVSVVVGTLPWAIAITAICIKLLVLPLTSWTPWPADAGAQAVVAPSIPQPGVYTDHDARLQRPTWGMAKGQSNGQKGASR